jgi:hypothetical protein
LESTSLTIIQNDSPIFKLLVILCLDCLFSLSAFLVTFLCGKDYASMSNQGNTFIDPTGYKSLFIITIHRLVELA